MLKNVLKGILTRHGYDTIHVISEDRILYSGSLDNWIKPDVDMIEFRHQLEKTKVVKHMEFHNEIFLFV